MKVVVASHNPVKLAAVRHGFERMFPDRAFKFATAPADSGVSDQPRSSAETLAGAGNRAVAAKAAIPDADYWVGVEGGVEELDLGLAAFAWIVVVGPKATGRGRSASFFLPDRVAELVRAGMELGAADDRVFGRRNSKQNEGAIGLLTGNVVDRTALYAHGVIMALIPFKRSDLYGGSDERR